MHSKGRNDEIEFEGKRSSAERHVSVEEKEAKPTIKDEADFY